MPMPERWRQTFLAYADEPEHRRRVAAATSRIADFLAEHHAYISFSGGKDSTAMLYLATRIAPEIAVYYSDNGPKLVPRAIHAEVLEVARAAGARDLRIRAPLNVAAVAAEGPFDGVFVGLREEEGKGRALRMRKGGRFGPVDECWPLRDWTWRDVWAYLVSHKVPVVETYHERAALEGYDRARFHTFFDPKFEWLGATAVDGVLHWRLRGR
jgi:3'-phosphoadenosine 5'-phosphosulfate sulfotransferase (PAPS reductase)/FAD synthetase